MARHGKLRGPLPDPLDRRTDVVTEAKVEMAILFDRVFSSSAAQQCMLQSNLHPDIRARVLQKRCRHRFYF